MRWALCQQGAASSRSLPLHSEVRHLRSNLENRHRRGATNSSPRNHLCRIGRSSGFTPDSLAAASPAAAASSCEPTSTLPNCHTNVGFPHFVRSAVPLLREQGVASSNLAAPTNHFNHLAL